MAGSSSWPGWLTWGDWPARQVSRSLKICIYCCSQRNSLILYLLGISEFGMCSCSVWAGEDSAVACPKVFPDKCPDLGFVVFICGSALKGFIGF